MSGIRLRGQPDYTQPQQQNTPEPEPEDDVETIVVIGKRLNDSAPPTNSPAVSFPLVREGHTNPPQSGLIETLRSLVVEKSRYDIDNDFTDSQKAIIRQAIQALANHPQFSAMMAELQEKGADINIIADFHGRHTFGEEAVLVGKNDDGTVDRGEVITIYIDMNFGSSPISDFHFAEVIIHELLHSLGSSSLDRLIDTPSNTLDSDLRREFFIGHDFSSSFVGPDTALAEVYDVVDTGGAVTGGPGYDIVSGSNFDDFIDPGSGGGLVFSGDGSDNIVIALDGEVTEIIEGGGVDAIVLPSGTDIASVTKRLSADGSEVGIFVAGRLEALILGSGSSSAVENVVIGSATYSLQSIALIGNQAPTMHDADTVVYDDFYGGYVTTAAATDPNGDALKFKIVAVDGDYRDNVWNIDEQTGAISANVTRVQQSGSNYTTLTVMSTDGLSTSTSYILVRWLNSNEPDTPIEAPPSRLYEEEPVSANPHLSAFTFTQDSGVVYA